MKQVFKQYALSFSKLSDLELASVTSLLNGYGEQAESHSVQIQLTGGNTGRLRRALAFILQKHPGLHPEFLIRMDTPYPSHGLELPGYVAELIRHLGGDVRFRFSLSYPESTQLTSYCGFQSPGEHTPTTALELIRGRLPVRIVDMSLGLPHSLKVSGESIATSERNAFSVFIYSCNLEIYQNSTRLLNANLNSPEGLKRLFGQFIRDAQQIIGIDFYPQDDRISLRVANGVRFCMRSNFSTCDRMDNMITFFMQGERPLRYSPEKGFYSSPNENPWPGEEIDSLC